MDDSEISNTSIDVIKTLNNGISTMLHYTVYPTGNTIRLSVSIQGIIDKLTIQLNDLKTRSDE